MVYVISKTGKPLMPTKPSRARKMLKAGKAIVSHELVFPETTARWVEIRVDPIPQMAENHPFAGMRHPFVFVDEIEIY